MPVIRGDSPKTSEAISGELESLLEISGAEKPYVIVAHSFGEVTIRRFIVDNLDDIAGIVLLETLNPGLYRAAEERSLDVGAEPPPWQMRLAGEIGIAWIMLRYRYPGTEKEDMVNGVTNGLVHRGLSANIEEIAATRPIC